MIRRISRILSELNQTNKVIVYRGTDKFRDDIHDGNFYSEDLEFAKSYGKTIRRYELTLSNCFDILNISDFNLLKKKVGRIYDPYVEDDEEYPELIDIKTPEAIANTGNSWEVTEEFIEDIGALGFDMAKIIEDGVVNYVLINPEKINLELIDTITEDYNSDKEKLRRATDIYSELVRVLPNLTPDKLTYFEHEKFPSLALDFSEIDSEFSNLAVLLVSGYYYDEKGKPVTNKRHPSLSKGTIDGEPKYLLILPLTGYSSVHLSSYESLADWEEVEKGYSDVLYKEKLDHATSLIRHKKSIVVHELIHYLDYQEYDISKSLDYKSPEKGDSYQDYISQPPEYNAFFMSMLSRANDRLDKLLSDEDNESYLKHIFSNFDEFESFLFDAMSIREPYKNDFIKGYDKRYMKRLYQYYQGKKKELGF